MKMTHNVEPILFNCTELIESFKCMHCTHFKTYKLVALKQHFKTGHELTEFEEELYKCQNCTFQTHSNYLFLRHRMLNLCPTYAKLKAEIEVTEETKEYRHEYHFETGESNILLNDFQRRHIWDGDLRCGKYFYRTSSFDLNNDKEQNHKFESQKLHECNYCPYSTKYVSHLKVHIIDRHTDPDKIEWFACEYCSYKSKRKFDLKKHTERKHSNPETAKCVHCPYETKRKEDLKRHMLVKHTNPDSINWLRCEHCLYKAKTRDSLRYHIKYKHGERKKPFKCEHCSFETTTNVSLKRHVLCKHTDDDKIEWFECEHCSYKAKAKNDLKKHLDHTHSKKKNFKCDRCHFRAKFGVALKNHVLLKHTAPENIVWFYCGRCSYKTQIKRYLRNHNVRRHCKIKKSIMT